MNLATSEAASQAMPRRRGACAAGCDWSRTSRL